MMTPAAASAVASFLLMGTAATSMTPAGGNLSASSSGMVLQRFHDVLETNSRRYFGDDEDAFRSAVDWHHSRLRAAAGGDVELRGVEGGGGGAAAAGAEVGAGAGARGTFAVFTSHRRGGRAREVLSAALSPSSVMTVAHNREQGGCFFVHASAADVDALLLLPEADEDEQEVIGGGGGGGGGGGRRRLFDGFVAVPPSLKLAPSLLDLDDDGISPGKALRRNSGVEGLVVVLLSPPLASSADDEDGLALVERWRRDWSSASLDLHSLLFWSAEDGHPRHCSGEREGEEDANANANTNTNTNTAAAEVLAREWGGAARTVHALAERLGGVSPAEACGWNDVRVEAEGTGVGTRRRSSSSGWVTLRNIGHLLPGESPDKSQPTTRPGSSSSSSGGGGRDSSDSNSDSEREKKACLMGLVSFLASRPEVARVSALPRAELSNEVAARIVQGASATSTPIWDRGVDGSGQVVQVVDSGVAQGSCFFRNSATTFGPDHGYLRDADGSLGTGDFQYDLSQRKVVQYIEGNMGSPDFIDDDEGGHGTHVAGSVAGSIYSGWTGPNACPDGVAGATADQTAISCVGACLAPSVLAEYVANNIFDLGALCPEYECDTYWSSVCLSDDRSETLEGAKGVAPNAKLAILDVGTSDLLEQAVGGTMWETSGGAGARLHSGSWGFPDDPCTMDDLTVSFDEWAFQNPEHLLIFAAGNLGDDISDCSISAPGLSKNSLAVGSSMSGGARLSPGEMDDVSDFSSRGPTFDGRIKPDIVAPGHFVFSAANGGDGSCELDKNSGTSMSCPIAAGAAALVRQYFVDGFYSDDLEARGGLCTATSRWACDPFSPSGALVKAMLIHGADAMGGSTDPDGDRGFGRIHLESAMPFEGEDLWALYVEDADGTTTSAGQARGVAAFEVEERSFIVSEEDAATVEAEAEGGPGGIRATLAWMDPAATASSSVQLIHDLDLFLDGPDGTTWTMSGMCSGDEASCSLDNRNNVERIVVPASDVTAGTWTVRVSAGNGLVEGGLQSYALAVSLPISSGGTAATTAVSSSASTPAPTTASVSPSTPGPTAGASPPPPTSQEATLTTAAPAPVDSTGDGFSASPSASPVQAAADSTTAPRAEDDSESRSSATPTPAASTTGSPTIGPSPAGAGVVTRAPAGPAADGTRAPLLATAAPESDDDGGGGGSARPTATPAVTTASPGRGTEEIDTSSVIYGGAPSSSDSASTSDGDGDDGDAGPRGIGETPSPSGGAVEGLGESSGVSRSVGSGGGRGVLWNAAVITIAAALSAAAGGARMGARGRLSW
ncbi:unnamed protein product [Pylaiella littoralis]